MRLKITLTLLAILLGLLTYIFYIDNQIDEDDYDQTRSNVLGDLAIGLDYLSILNNATGQRITLQLRNNKWFLTEPYEWPANEFAVQRILTELRFLERISSFETDIVSQSGVSMSDYGLRPPQSTLFLGRGKERVAIGIGKPTEIGNNLYILSTDQSQVLVVNRSLLESLSVSLDSLRSSRLFQTAVFEVTSWNIQVRENNRNVRAWFAKEGDRWNFQTPIRARADSAAVNTLLNRCLNLEADSIVASNPTDLSPYGLQSPLYRIAIESDQNREVLEIGERISPESDFRYAKRESRPTVFQLRIDFLDTLGNAQTKLRERRIFELDVTAASTLTIERRDEQPLTLQKLENGSWELVVRHQEQGIQTQKGDAEIIEEILLWLNELKAVPGTGFVNDAPSAPDLESYGLEVPEYSITITSNRVYASEETLSQPATETLLIGDRSPDDRMESFVKRQSKDFVYSVYNDIFERIDNNPDRYKDRQIIDLPAGQRISRLTISRIANSEQLASFSLEANSAAPERARSLAAQIASLTVESFNPGGYTPTVDIAGRETPWVYQLTATVRNGNDDPDSAPEPIELLVSETSGGPLLYGAIPDRDLSFRFDIDFIDAFSEIVFDRVARPAPQQPFSSRPLPEQASQDQSQAQAEPESLPVDESPTPEENAAETSEDTAPEPAAD
ncbi:DUF4340 domain-containing protein [Pelagicoccus sp. SDUM812003]|uniref:DUF4340 domain-containing protein n=1 Tax=Pelagicoccus sp. SDUM812003 TaxID=3041267 RepID=UPI00280FA538|nr:DUF4340 domain-containing protein [Pelagicoccus sp. SDUM812003]MDQ8202709.1 DUF4340 domain-containing protein [Pelagicoccus sp. SDUM812003]